MRGSGYRKPRGERLDRKEPPAPSWPGRWGGSRGRAAPLAEPLAERWLLGRRRLGPAAGPTGGAAFRPLLLGLALRAVTLVFPRSGAEPPVPWGRPSASARAMSGACGGGGTGRFTPRLRSCAPPLSLIFVALHLVTDFYFYAGVLGRKVAKVHSAFIDVPCNLLCSLCEGGTIGRFQCRERNDYFSKLNYFSLEKYYHLCLSHIEFQWCLLKSGLGIVLGNTADDM